MSVKPAGRSTYARALPSVEPTGCTYTHARAMQFLYGRTYVRTDGRTHHVTTKFSRLHRLPYFFKNGAPLRGRSAREGAPLSPFVTSLNLMICGQRNSNSFYFIHINYFQFGFPRSSLRKKNEREQLLKLIEIKKRQYCQKYTRPVIIKRHDAGNK